MLLRRLLAAVTLVAAGLVAAPAPAAQADPIVLPEIDFGLLSCTELVPHALALTNGPVRLQLRVLIDGDATRRDAREGVASMRRAYAPLGISVVPSYREVRFRGNDAGRLIAQAKRLYDGRAPHGVDAVYVLSSKDLVTSGPIGGNLAGLADCIGGVQNPRTAFAVGEVGRTTAPSLSEGTGKTMAHEVGHLLGGHHHYCSPEGLLAADPAPLSLMGPVIDLIALRFSTLNAVMVRGHAQAYA